jgi:hypothetical protein
MGTDFDLTLDQDHQGILEGIVTGLGNGLFVFEVLDCGEAGEEVDLEIAQILNQSAVAQCGHEPVVGYPDIACHVHHSRRIAMLPVKLCGAWFAWMIHFLIRSNLRCCSLGLFNGRPAPSASQTIRPSHQQQIACLAKQEAATPLDQTRRPRDGRSAAQLDTNESGKLHRNLAPGTFRVRKPEPGQSLKHPAPVDRIPSRLAGLACLLLNSTGVEWSRD